MALTPEQQDHLVFLGQFADRMLENERIDAEMGNYEWYGAPDFDALITQEALDEFAQENPNSPLAKLTLTDIAEVEYVRGQLHALLDNKFPHLYNVRKAAK